MAAFTLNVADLEFILRQIKVSEAHAAGTPLTEIYVDANGDVVTVPPGGTPPPGAFLAIPDPHVPVGLRTVDGTYNNIVPGRELWGAADQPMPRMLDGTFVNDADGDSFDPDGPFGPAPTVTNTNYGNSGNVADADPRTISNLVADMSLGNPAAIFAALTFAGSEDPQGDLEQLLALRVTPAEAAAALATAQTALGTAVGNLATAIAGFNANDPATIDAIQTAAAAVTTAEAAVTQAQQVAANPAAALRALAEEMGLVINEEGSLVIPNVAPDEGLSAPFNAWMTFFGQFFDHGLDLITKGGDGTIYIPLQPDDPLYVEGGHTNFMVLTRATTDAEGNHTNTTTGWVDQNQTYTSHASHQVFLREYELGADGKPEATGRLLDGIGPDGEKNGLPTWADVKAQALSMLGIQLTDRDVLNIPLVRTDQYGNFIPHPVTGFAQVVIGIGGDGIPNTADDIVVSGTPQNPVNTFTATNGVLTGAVRIGHAFLDDIAHNAVPGTVFDHDGNPATAAIAVQADADSSTGNAIGTDTQGRKTAYDNELLDRHFVTGDGRGNENIGLTAVHHIFHSEHNRQIDSQMLTVLKSGDVDFINEWLDAEITALPANFSNLTALQQLDFANSLDWNGERLFQGARFATEMQYQHLVFEEFARKVQPAIDPFVFNSVTDIDPSIFSEFANVVYRFGHSMLTDSMPRILLNEDGSVNSTDDMGLITAFLNPVAFDNDNALTAEQAAGAIVRGMTTERGNAIDEFVTGSLRNSLLGLPLDLPAINIARGRDTGMPTLNSAREQLFGATGSSFLTPYSSWTEFAGNLKNPISVVNFIAAYGTHTSVTTATTLAAKRDAAWALVFGEAVGSATEVPSDRLAFLNSTGAWNAANSGLDTIDLWIGGLAEKAMPFGGMLGSTFNAVFEAQLEALQDGDRFYYLTRTQGQNFLNMLEQNSFAKMIMANTDIADPGPDGIRGTADDIIARHIGVDSFANYDFVLEVNPANQADYNGNEPGVDPLGTDAALEAMGLGKVVRDDPGTAGPDANYIRFTGGEHVVVGGTNGNDTIIADFGDDGIWGDAGNDRIESGAGVDLVNGGAGDDIITDSGDTGDFIKGDEGNDVIANSNGIDILMGGTGKDVIFVGVDDTEVFGGEGDDFIAGGDGVDLLMGNEGDDWIEGAGGFDTTAGDNSELFFNSAIKGHDVMFAGSEEHDFDAESGDDIMVQGESVIRNEGMFGFDWAIFKGVNIDGYADMRIPIFTTEQEDILRNRFDKVEALSGWNRNDTLLGDDRVFGEIAPGDTVATTEAIFFNDGLDQAGIDRIAGLGQIVSVGTSGFFEAGNILLGGAGSDSLRGNGGDDILDGDRWLNVRISITANGDGTGGQVATVDSLRHTFAEDFSIAAWRGKSLFELMIDRVVAPGQLQIVREILTAPANPNDIDVAHFNDVYQNADGTFNYTITRNADGSIRVEHINVNNVIDPLTERNLVSDGVDTLRNIEKLRFSDGFEISLTAPQLRLNAFDPSGNYADNFGPANYGNSNGTRNWGPDWSETGDDNSATAAAGQIRITGSALVFDQGNGATIQRQVDLSMASAARLSFTANPDGLDANESVTVEFSRDGVNFVTLDTITGNGGNTPLGYDLTGPFEADAVIRFVASGISNNNEQVAIDSLSIEVFVPANPATIDHQVTFTENGAAVAIASLPGITDDATVMESARIVLTNAQAGDTLAATGLAGTGITATTTGSAPGQIVITLTGSASIAAYQRAIQGVTFDTNSDNPGSVARIVEVTVSDGFNDSNIARSTINVVAVNDAPNAVNDSVITNFTTAPFVVPEWALLANDTDVDSPVLDITATSGLNSLTSASLTTNPGSVTITDGAAGQAGGSFNYTANDGAATDVAQATVTRDTTGTIDGTAGNNILVGNDAASTLDAGTGDDIVFAGGGNDTIVWNANGNGATDGRDYIDGGAGVDTVSLTHRNNVAETFRVYTLAEAQAAGMTGLKANTEIVITRNGTNNASIVAELDNIEEISIDIGNGDSVVPIGNFSPTSLNVNTIRINGSAGDDTVDISSLASAHRIVFRSNGGNDTIVGTLRPQDVIELADGQSLANYTSTTNANGTTTLSNGTHSITFVGSGSGPIVDDGTITGTFEYTASDVAGITALVRGLQPPGAGDDDVPTGVRNLSGAGNNVDNPTWGNADQAFIRLTEARYGEPDAFGNRDINPIFSGLDARNISNILGTQEAGLPKAGNDANIFFMAMGQYIDHGLDFLPKGGNGSLTIGGVGGGAPGSDNPADLTRGSVLDIDENGIPQHKNQTSPFVDQNQAYGSNNLVGQFLRESDGAQGHGSHLLAGVADPSNPDFKLLPTLRELIVHHWEADTIFEDPHLPGSAISFRDYYTNFETAPGVSGTLYDAATGTFDAAVVNSMLSNFMGSTHPLLLDTNPFVNVLDHFVAGDGRANENFALTSIHTIWARNHNFHVEKLLSAGFEGTAEELFQAAKMVNEAEYQRVVFDEYLDTLLGGLKGSGSHGFDDYNPNVDPAISHEFAAAVFRFGHSLIGQTMTVLDADGNPTQVQLFDAFLNPSNADGVFTGPLPPGYVPQPGYAQHGVSAIIGGTVTQPAEEVDFNIVDAVRNDLVRIRADLFAFNVTRAWDLGIGTLNQVRMDLAASTSPYLQEAIDFAGGSLTPYSSWEDFQQRNGLSDAVIAQFRQAYPDLVLQADEIALFQQVNPNIELIDNGDGTRTVKGIDRVDLWVGGLAEQHINDGLVGQTFWVILHEQFDRLQEADRFYYIDRFDNFDLYETFIDGQEFADIVFRNTGIEGLPEHMFEVSDEDGNDTGNNDDDNAGNDDDDDAGNDDDGDTGNDDDDDDNADDDEDNAGNDDDDDDAGNDDDDDTGDDDAGNDDDDDDDTDDDDTANPPPNPSSPSIAAVVFLGTVASESAIGGTADDTLVGNGGDDTLFGLQGNDNISGDAGNDVLVGDLGDDLLLGGDGADRILAGDGADRIFGGSGDDTIFGDAGNDVIFGDAGRDVINAGSGDDTAYASQGDGDDVLDGGEGANDTLDYSAIIANLTVNLGSGGVGSAASAQSGTDTLRGFEHVIGGAGNDTITASSAVNVLDGGAGNDTFVFTSATAANGDRIVGFETGDQIDLRPILSSLGINDDVANHFTTSAFNLAGQVRLRVDGGDTVIEGNTDSQDDVDFSITVVGRTNLNGTDFS